MARNEIVPQYYNLFDSTKGYTELLFRAGKVLQSKELNELQSILKEQIKNVGDTILTDGDIIEGCQLLISDDRRTVSLTPGKIYLEGNVRSIPTLTSLAISGTGIETIGAKLSSVVISPDDDATLNDVATGYDNYNQDGAFRLKETISIVLNDSEATTIYTLKDGEKLSETASQDLTQLDKINNTLARRTFDESGNYKVENLHMSHKSYDDNYIYIEVNSGRAYIEGYEVNLEANTAVRLDRPTEVKKIEIEPKTYETGTLKYLLSNPYVKAITKVSASVEVTENRVRGSIEGGIDYLSKENVLQIVSISQGTTTFTKGVDYQLYSNGVDWLIEGNEPAEGSTYTVTYRYNKQLLPDVDYTLERDGIDGYLKFLDGGDKPVNDAQVNVDYEFYLYRYDVISLDRYGTLMVTKGQPDIYRTVTLPPVNSVNNLVLGSVLLVPEANYGIITENKTQAIKMLELYTILQRISDLEYNQAISDLDREAADGESATELKGVLTDGFIGYSKMDMTHPEWFCIIDTYNETLTLPVIEFSTNNGASVMQDAEKSTVSNFTNESGGGLILNQILSEEVISQSNASGIIAINSYMAYSKEPTVVLDPENDTWPATTREEKGQTNVVNINSYRWWYHGNDSYAQQGKKLVTQQGLTVAEVEAAVKAASGGKWSMLNNVTLTKESKSISTTTQEQEYMYQREVTITISDLRPLIDNVVTYFNDIKVNVTPLNSTYAGTESGSLKADTNGEAKGKFTVPANVSAPGPVYVKVYSTIAPQLVGIATYTCNTTQNITVTTKTQTKYNVRFTDPVAQSFVFEGEGENNDHFVTAVGLYFADIKNNGENDEGITVQLREMSNGFPTRHALAQAVIKASDVKVSSNGTAETKIVFDHPVHCKTNTEYCFTVLSYNDRDALFYGELGEKDLVSQGLITVNPYLGGVMFSSSNNSTWSAHQSSDLKFNLYTAKFNTSSTWVTKEITSNDPMHRIVFTLGDGGLQIPANCSISWQYSVDGGTNWNPISPNFDIEMLDSVTSVRLRCIMSGTEHVSPTFSLSNLSFAAYTNLSPSVYVSRNISLPDGFNNIKISFNAYLPEGAGLNVYYATDISGTNWQSIPNTSSVQVSSKYTTYTYEKTLDAPAYNYRVKIVLTSEKLTLPPSVQKLMNILKTV